MALDRPRVIGKTDKVLLEWKPVHRSGENRESATLSSETKNPDLIFITIIMAKELNKPCYVSVRVFVVSLIGPIIPLPYLRNG